MGNLLLGKEQLVQCNFPEYYLEMDPGLMGCRVTFNQVNDDDHHHHGADDYYNDENGDDFVASIMWNNAVLSSGPSN